MLPAVTLPIWMGVAAVLTAVFAALLASSAEAQRFRYRGHHGHRRHVNAPGHVHHRGHLQFDRRHLGHRYHRPYGHARYGHGGYSSRYLGYGYPYNTYSYGLSRRSRYGATRHGYPYSTYSYGYPPVYRYGHPAYRYGNGGRPLRDLPDHIGRSQDAGARAVQTRPASPPVAPESGDGGGGSAPPSEGSGVESRDAPPGAEPAADKSPAAVDEF